MRVLYAVSAKLMRFKRQTNDEIHQKSGNACRIIKNRAQTLRGRKLLIRRLALAQRGTDWAARVTFFFGGKYISYLLYGFIFRPAGY